MHSYKDDMEGKEIEKGYKDVLHFFYEMVECEFDMEGKLLKQITF